MCTYVLMKWIIIECKEQREILEIYGNVYIMNSFLLKQVMSILIGWILGVRFLKLKTKNHRDC